MTGHTEHVAELNVGIAVHDGVGMVVVARIVVFLEIIANEFAVVFVVVPVHVVIIVSDARPVRRFVVHVNVTAKQVVVLVLHGVVVEEDGQSVGPMKLFASA